MPLSAGKLALSFRCKKQGASGPELLCNMSYEQTQQGIFLGCSVAEEMMKSRVWRSLRPKEYSNSSLAPKDLPKASV